MTVNAKDILDAAKARFIALNQAYKNEDLKTFKSLAETSFISGDEEIKFPTPVLDEDYCFSYKGHRFMVLNNVSASNKKIRSGDCLYILTDITTIWEVVYKDGMCDYRFVCWLYWEFDTGMEVDSFALDCINEYFKKKEEQHA